MVPPLHFWSLRSRFPPVVEEIRAVLPQPLSCSRTSMWPQSMAGVSMFRSEEPKSAPDLNSLSSSWFNCSGRFHALAKADRGWRQEGDLSPFISGTRFISAQNSLGYVWRMKWWDVLSRVSITQAHPAHRLKRRQLGELLVSVTD